MRALMRKPELTATHDNTPTFAFGTTLRTLRPECHGGQHTYTQGEDAGGFEQDNLRKLLFCQNCGDVIPFVLPVTEEMP